MNKTREKETIIAIMAGCLVFFAIFSLPWLWMVALAVGLAGLLSNRMTHWIHVAWFTLADKIGFITSRLVLGTIFILVLIPLALLAKLFRRDLMLLKGDHPSYFVERPQQYQRDHLQNPW